VRQTFGVEIVPRRRPLGRERLQTQFPATRYGGLVATMEFDAVHAELHYLRFRRGRGRVLLLGLFALYETLPEPVLRISNTDVFYDQTRVNRVLRV